MFSQVFIDLYRSIIGYHRRRYYKKKIINVIRGMEFYLYSSLLRESLTLPDFLIIGVPKAGTWWLANNLAAHPDIFLATGESRGELHYFDENFHHSVVHYAQMFKPANGRVAGEKTPGYCYLSKQRICLIHMLIPDVRLLILIRNPITRLWSEAMMMLIRKPANSFAELDRDILLGWLKRNKNRVLYSRIFKNWESIYPTEQLFVGFLEDIKRNPKALLSRAYDHLGVSTRIDWSTIPYKTVMNKGPQVPIPDEYYALLRHWYQPELDWLDRRYGR